MATAGKPGRLKHATTYVTCVRDVTFDHLVPTGFDFHPDTPALCQNLSFCYMFRRDLI